MNDVTFDFDQTLRLLTVGNAAQNSANVLDLGSAKRLFEGDGERKLSVQANYKITVGTGALSIRIQFVGASAAALNAGVEVLWDSGIITLDGDGTALAIGDLVTKVGQLANQRVACRYYGFIYTQGTADQNGEMSATLVLDPASNMVARKLATP